jgi:hypothetical protein
MLMPRTWWNSIRPKARPSPSARRTSPARFIPGLECLEGRDVPSVLVFESTSGGPNVHPGYGDRVKATSQDGDVYGSQAGFTPNVTVDYSHTLPWGPDYGDLMNVAYVPQDSGVLDITFRADPGYKVSLHSFDLAGWPNTSYTIGSLQVLDGTGRALFARSGVGVPGTGHAHFDFAPLDGETLTIRIDSGNLDQESWNVGIDNVVFSQQAAARATSIQWHATRDAVQVSYEVLGKETLTSLELALYWTSGAGAQAERLGPAVVTRTVTRAADLTPGAHTLTIPTSEFASDAPFTTNPIGLQATHLQLHVGPDESDEEPPAEAIKDLALKRIIVGAGFQTQVGDATLDAGLMERFAKFASHLISRNYVSNDITLNDGVRDPEQAHRWSTTYSILNDKISLATLQGLPDGRDEDGNLWYDPAWLEGLPRKANGALTAAGRKQLWAKIKDNARDVSSDRGGNYAKPAAEGYDDSRRAPNNYPKVSKHCRGFAIDATVPWRVGAKVGNSTLGNGKAGDNVAKGLVAQFSLLRPLLEIQPVKKQEWWHYQ